MNEQYNLDFKFHTNSSVKRKVWGISFSVMSIMFIGVILLSALCSLIVIYSRYFITTKNIYFIYIINCWGNRFIISKLNLSIFYKKYSKKVLFSAPFEFIFESVYWLVCYLI